MHLPFLDQRVRATASMLHVVFVLTKFANGLHAVDSSISLLKEVVLYVGSVPTSICDDTDMLRRHDDRGLAERNTAVISHCVGNRVQHVLWCVTAVVLNIAETASSKNCHAADPVGIFLILYQKRPRIAASSFGNTKTIFSGIALCRLVGHAGHHSEDIH